MLGHKPVWEPQAQESVNLREEQLSIRADGEKKLTWLLIAVRAMPMHTRMRCEYLK